MTINGRLLSSTTIIKRFRQKKLRNSTAVTGSFPLEFRHVVWGKLYTVFHKKRPGT